MSIECRPSNVCSDVRCEVCGQGFLLYGDRHSSEERRSVRAIVQRMLREQHGDCEHPAMGFVVDWTPMAVETC